MKQRMALIFLYLKENTGSFNALAGALESEDLPSPAVFVKRRIFFREE